MNNFRNDRSNRRGSPRRNSGRRNSGSRQMYDAVCDNCGKDCKVPFRPTDGKPIYCSDCFEKQGNQSRGESDRRGGGQRDFRGGGSKGSDQVISNLSKKVDDLNEKMDTILSMLSERSKQSKVSDKAEVEIEKEIKPKKIKKKAVKKTSKSSTEE